MEVPEEDMENTIDVGKCSEGSSSIMEHHHEILRNRVKNINTTKSFFYLKPCTLSAVESIYKKVHSV